MITIAKERRRASARKWAKANYRKNRVSILKKEKDRIANDPEYRKKRADTCRKSNAKHIEKRMAKRRTVAHRIMSCEIAKRFAERHPDRLKRRNENYYKRNKDKVKAHRTVRWAVQKGTLIKQPCEVCGSIVNIHGHHEDYSKPLEVKWLCPLHHKEIHNLTKI